ncbi:MAG TPA: VTT domain-containing protein [Bryobacteraceae bacterium]|nr:VTT domain-containing protein [Bryobacteraceae bacterium]
MLPQFILIALATLVSEDLTCVATGLLIAQGRIGFVEGTAACVAGICLGDLALFAAGRFIGRPVLRWQPLARVISEDRIERGTRWLAERGLSVIFLSRFMPGLRLPTYFAAGLLRTRTATFALYFFLASAIWTPLLVGGTVLSRNFASYGVVLPIAFGLVRIAPNAWKRALRWEFWPMWAAYLPVVPYFLYLCARHRSFAVFTAANPGIFSGGLVGESKSAILSRLPAAAEFVLIPRSLPLEEKVELASRFAFPMVLKPDQGERGVGVAIVRTETERNEYLRVAKQDIVAQRYVSGVEFGVFYCRFPDEAHGRILSITEKRFPVLIGDGRSRLSELVQRDERAACMADTYAKLSRRAMSDVPEAGERVQLVEIGSHCRGSIFLNGAHLNTPALEAEIGRIARAHDGFYFGRFDLRAPSVEDFRQGIGLQVLELNGVAAEATHIYDPSVSVWEAYRIMFRHWRLAFAIGRRNVELGAQSMTLGELVRLVWKRRR